MYYLINIYRSVSAKGPYKTLAEAERIYASINEGLDDGWVIVKSILHDPLSSYNVK